MNARYNSGSGGTLERLATNRRPPRGPWSMLRPARALHGRRSAHGDVISGLLAPIEVRARRSGRRRAVARSAGVSGLVSLLLAMDGARVCWPCFACDPRIDWERGRICGKGEIGRRGVPIRGMPGRKDDAEISRRKQARFSFSSLVFFSRITAVSVTSASTPLSTFSTLSVTNGRWDES